jgi:MFS family permease
MSKTLPRTVIILGFVSFFNDLASEMVVPLIPILLTTILGAGPVALGLIEGVADAVSAWLRLWSGRHSDVMGGRRKPLTVAGYFLSNLARPLFGLAASWPLLLLLRATDRVGKGLRSAPRDALVADTTPPEIRGFAYGFHRALDNAGAVGGSLVAAAVLAWSSLSIPHVIMWSAIPGFLGVLLVALGVQEKRAQSKAAQVRPPLRWAALSPTMRRYLLVLGLFTFARASETFIMLRGHELGMGVVELLLLWAALNLAKAMTSTRGGVLADRVGKMPMVIVGWATMALAFLLLGHVDSAFWLWPATLAYGLFIGLAEGPERALISDLALENERGTAFGWYHLILGIAAIPAGFIFGKIWQVYGADTAFDYAAVVGLISALLVRYGVRRDGVAVRQTKAG